MGACDNDALADRIGAKVNGSTISGCHMRSRSGDVDDFEAFARATFTAERANRVIATFRSDSQGRFEVRLAPGTYAIVPGQDAPLIAPRAQAKEVSVASGGTTTVVLTFDTGIR